MAGAVNLPARSPVSVPGPTGRRPWSTMLLREWAALKYPGVYLQEQVRLGPTSAVPVGQVLTPELEAMLRVVWWYADGILITPTEVLIVEAKMPPDTRAVGQVLFYQELAPTTPALTAYLSLPFTPVVLFAESDDRVNRFCRRLGVRVEIFTPSWIADYLVAVQFRRRLS